MSPEPFLNAVTPTTKKTQWEEAGRPSKTLKSSIINKQSERCSTRPMIPKILEQCILANHPPYLTAALFSLQTRYQSQDYTSPKISNARAVEQSSTLSSPWPFPELFWRLIAPWGEAPRQPWAQNRGSIRSPFGPVPANSSGDYFRWDKWLFLPIMTLHLWVKQHCFCPWVEALWIPQASGHASVCIPVLNPTPNSVSALLVPAITGLQWN